MLIARVKPASLVAVVFLSLVALVHLLRLIWRVEMTVSGVTIPIWLSALGCVVPGTIALMMWRENRRS